MFAQNENSRPHAARWRRVPRIGLLIAMVSTISCGSGDGSNGSDDVPSADVGTAGIDASVSIVSLGDGRAEILVDLDTPPPDFDAIELSDGERFEASHGASTRMLDRDSGPGEPRYVTAFMPASPMDPFVLRFVRADDSVVDLPLIALDPEFDVTSPREGDSFTFADTVLLEWNPARPGHQIEIRLYSACALTTGGTGSRLRFLNTEDDGSEPFELSTLSRADDPIIDQSRDCRLVLRFDREVSVTISPPFASGSRVVSTQRRALDLPLRF